MSKCTLDPKTIVTCDDGEACTKNTCDAKTGKCDVEKLVKSCDDSNLCTAGDACGNDAQSGKYTCVPGKAKNCDDNVACTVDSCDPLAGCKNVSAIGKNVACYSGPAGTQGVGICKAGAQTCKQDGTLTKCQGEVTPAAKELCGNKVGGALVDDNCDGKVDEGCGPTQVIGHLGSGAVSGVSGKLVLRGSVGASAAAGPTVGDKAKVSINSGFYARLKAWLK